MKITRYLHNNTISVTFKHLYNYILVVKNQLAKITSLQFCISTLLDAVVSIHWYESFNTFITASINKRLKLLSIQQTLL